MSRRRAGLENPAYPKVKMVLYKKGRYFLCL